VHSIIKMINS